jgi:hypothetical protein
MAMPLNRFHVVPALFCLAAGIMPAQTAPKAPSSLRLYVMDCGVIKGLAVTMFGFKEGEVPIRDFAVPCSLVVHPKGTLMWDVGVIPDEAFPVGGGPVTQGISTATKPLKAQLAEIGYKPADITYLSLSHYHSDHTANANQFAASTWLVPLAERNAMFATTAAGIMQQSTYAALKSSKTVILGSDDYYVFGDGTVVTKSAPGHTPGHQVLFLKLAKYRPAAGCRRSLSLPRRRNDESVPRSRPSAALRSTSFSRKPARRCGSRRRDVRQAEEIARVLRLAYFNALAPAWAVWLSWSLLPPEAPTAPMTLPSTIIGMPPATGTAPVRPSIRRPSPPAASVSWNDFVGRRKSTADFAFPIETSTLPNCVSGIRSK